MFGIYRPPRLFSDVRFQRHTDRSVGWLELFYDLVYVATLIQIGNFLSDNLTLLGFGQFLVLFVVVWWAWTGETFYQNRYYVDDLVHRFLVFTQMFAVAGIGLSVSGAFGELYVQFTLAYVLTRLIMVLMYVRAYHAHEPSRHFLRTYITGFSIGIAVWLGSLLLPADYHWVGWLVGIAVELTVPLIPVIRNRRVSLPHGVDQHHISERFGIFTIIVLGEAFVKILDDAQGSVIGMPQIWFGVFGVLVLYSLWWLYFTDTAGKLVDFTRQWKPITWIYGHMPLSAALVAFGVGTKKLYSSTLTYASDTTNPDYRLLYMTAVALYLVALALIDFGLDDEETAKSQNREAIIHLICAVIVVVIGLVATVATPAQFVGLIAVIMVGQVALSIIDTTRADPSFQEHSKAEHA